MKDPGLPILRTSFTCVFVYLSLHRRHVLLVNKVRSRFYQM